MLMVVIINTNALAMIMMVGKLCLSRPWSPSQPPLASPASASPHRHRDHDKRIESSFSWPTALGLLESCSLAWSSCNVVWVASQQPWKIFSREYLQCHPCCDGGTLSEVSAFVTVVLDFTDGFAAYPSVAQCQFHRTMCRATH